MTRQFFRFDAAISQTMRRIGVPMARLSLGLVFIWFGLLKVVGESPANELVARTVYWVDPDWFLPFLGYWEIVIGICLVDPLRWVGRSPWLTRLGILLLFAQMPGTFLPLVVLPEVCFEEAPLVPTLEGQYIIKNLVLIAAALAIGGTVRADEARAHEVVRSAEGHDD
jgi:uncharacterized membrane protein YkgB